MVRKSRTIKPFQQKCGTEYVTYSKVCDTGATLPLDVRVPRYGVTTVGSEETHSEEHPGWHKRLKGDNLSDVGGEFWSQKRYCYGIPSNINVEAPVNVISPCIGRTNRYAGPAWSIDARLHSFPPSNSSTNSQLDQLGATAVSRCKPTNSAANIAVALGETIREGIPKLVVQTWKPRTQSLKELADNHLSYQFGLAPLGQEIGTFAAAVVDSERLLAQYERDAGRVVRRRYTFPPRIEQTIEDIGVGYTPYMGSPVAGTLNPNLTSTQHRECQVVKTLEQKRWFSGAFTYYLPRGYDARNEMDRKALLAKEILGLDLDLDTIWNLAPWSWAVDWFSNAGDVISNVNSYLEDGLVMRYGYMMEHTIVSHTYTRKYPNVYRTGHFDSAVTLVTETKIRRRANPFGFGVSWDALTGFQASILAALGIKRGL